jgi:tetratricopeptide (TPR) repeat protein
MAMNTRLFGYWAVAALLAAGAARATESEPQKTIDEWRGRRVLAAAPGVLLREQPDEQAPVISVSPAGIWLDVKRSQGEWLEVDWGWLRAADAVREDQAVEHFTAELAKRESAFANIARSRGWLVKKEFDKAQADVSEALRLEPNNARAYFAHSRIAEEQGRPEDELSACERALGIDPRDPIVLATRAACRIGAGQYEQAISDLDAAIQSLPNDSYLWSLRGFCWAEKDNFDRALTDFNEATRLDPNNADALTMRARVHFNRMEFDTALEDVEAALQAGAKLAEALAIRGAVRAKRGELDAALADFDESIRLGATDPRAFLNRGQIHFLKGRYDAAVIDFTQAISLNAANADAYLQRAEAWKKKGDNASAVIDLTQYLQIRPKDAKVYAERGWLNYSAAEEAADVDAALADFNAALEIDPRHASALIGRSQIWKWKHEPAKAMDDANTAVDAAPQLANAYTLRGWLRTDADLDGALKDLNTALEISPRLFNALLQRAEVWRRKDELAKAIADLTTAIEVDPKSAVAYFQRSQILIARGEHRQAIDDLTAALQFNPGDADWLLRRANEWRLSGNAAKAIEDCLAVLAKEPKNLRAYAQMAQAHSMAGQGEQALEDYAAALQIDPHDEQIRFDRVYELFKQDKFDLAMADIDEVIQHGKRVADGYTWRSYLWMQRKNSEKALADSNEAIRLQPDAEQHWRIRADCWLRMKQFDKAIADIDEALRLKPNSKKAASVRRRILEAQSHASQADRPDDAAATYGAATYGAATYGAATYGAALPVEETSDKLRARYYPIKLCGPEGVKVAFANFGPELAPLPIDLTIHYEMLTPFKITDIPGHENAALFAMLEAKPLSPQDIATLREAHPSIALTQADFDAALADKEVTKMLVLRRREGDSPAKPEFEVLSGELLDSDDDPIAAAARRGTVAAALSISQRQVRHLPSLHDKGMISFCLNGPEGLTLSHERQGRGRYADRSIAIPAHFGFFPGSTMDWKLGGPPVTAMADVYASLTIAPARALEQAKLGQDDSGQDVSGQDELGLTISKADLDAALEGKQVTRVVYLTNAAGDGQAPRLQTLCSTELAPGKDLLAEASAHGTIVATLKLTNEPFEGQSLHDAIATGEQPVAASYRSIPLRLRGPQGLALAYESTTPGEFDRLTIPMPAHFALAPGDARRFKLSGPPLGEQGPIYALLTLPAGAGESLKTIYTLAITLSDADLEAARAGKLAACVVYRENQAEDGGTARLKTLSITELNSAEDALAEAPKRGTVLAVLLLSPRLADLPLEGVESEADVDTKANLPTGGKTPAEGRKP